MQNKPINDQLETHNSQSGIVVFNQLNTSPTDYQFVEISPEVAQLLGTDSNSLIGKQLSEILPSLSPTLQELFSIILSISPKKDIEFFSQLTQKRFNVAIH